MNTAQLILTVFSSLAYVVFFMVVGLMIAYYLFRLALIYLPDKKVTVYTRNEQGKVVKVRTTEYIADLLWGDKT